MTKSRTSSESRWLLLIHQIPPKPDYLRVKVGRRLQRLGAIAVKNSVYALPDATQAFEDFQWIRREITDAKGDASICRADFVDGLTNEQLRALFRKARDDDYSALAANARELMGARQRQNSGKRDRAGRSRDELARLQKSFAAIEAIDFFGAPQRAAAQAALDALESQLNPQAATRRGAERPLERKAYRGRTWVTRRDVFVDRMASAWLIRRFVDVAAKLKFVVEDYRPRKGELRFDMFDGEFTHEGDRCSFETLLRRFGLEDAALVQLGEIVHNIDMKDEKFVRPDVPGIEQLLLGLVRAHRDDSVRVERASALFDDLYAAFSSGSRPARQSRGTARRR